MATYLYETVPSKADEEPKLYEIKQSMNDRPLSAHPETGEPIRRVMTGGFGVMTKGGAGASARPAPSGPSCGPKGCGCC